MFIEKISNFLPNYSNFTRVDFKNIIKVANNNGFDDYKMEKDFLLTLILIKFGEKYPNLIFKGGTCLNKIYFPYFRLSEDLDFVLNIDLSRDKRKKVLKKYENSFIEDLGLLGISLKEDRTKFDEHKLAMFTFEYKSVINNSNQTIKIDISLKNQLELSLFKGEIKSTYVDAILEENIFGTHFVNCINLTEALAEKMRAALTRKTPAIRDFFDIWYVKNNSDFNFESKEYKDLLEIKLKEVNFDYTFDTNFKVLEKQVVTDLRPVLNQGLIDNFDFKEIFEFIRGFRI